MLLGYMTGFAGYLNDNGYEVTQDKISHFLSLKNEEIDFTKEEDILPLMKVCFCRNKKEQVHFLTISTSILKSIADHMQRKKNGYKKSRQKEWNITTPARKKSKKSLHISSRN